jgi:hypothetical protein
MKNYNRILKKNSVQILEKKEKGNRGTKTQGENTVYMIKWQPKIQTYQ